jgi:hypothetical protein
VSIFGAGRLIRENAVVDVEALSVTQVEGGTVQAYTAVASGVSVLMTLFNGNRGRAFSTSQTDRVTVSGVDDSLRRRDIRLKVVTAPTTMSQYDDAYLAVDSAVPHPAGLGGLLNARITLQCSRLDMPKV